MGMRPSWRDEAEEPAPQGDADAARRPRNASATAANRRLKLRQRLQAARSLQAAKFKPEYFGYAIRDLAATGEDLVRQANPASAQNRPEGFTEPDSGTPCPPCGESAGRSPAKLLGIICESDHGPFLPLIPYE